MATRKKAKTLTADELAKAVLLEQLRPLAATLEAPLPFALSAQVRHLGGVTFRTREYLNGMAFIDMHPLQSLFLAATDLHGNGYPAEEVLGLLISGAKAWGDPGHLDVALNCIARAYCKPRVAHREIMKQREGKVNRNTTSAIDPVGMTRREGETE